MTLGEKQRKFTKMVGKLISFAYDNGYELTFGHTYRCKDCKVGAKNSLHKDKLAVDFNLFKDGKYLKKTKDHYLLGWFWESMDGTWGGRFEPPDGNHYSLEHRGRK